MTDFEAFTGMLGRAAPGQPWQELAVRVTGRERVIVFTGPDDAAAVFRFAPDGSIRTVSVVEAHPELE